ncbi:MAG TPA: sigma-70 family RNA polymerase sigma factor [Actinomycetota bacterium]|nr:sigma-70 family RNA polymerase sigma factor [Actinomycetota bacterium]
MVIRVPDQRNTPDGYAVLDDRLLVLDFQAGNPQAFVEIHRRYGGLARHVCGRFLSSQQDVDDALQETMIRVFQGLYRFNGRYALQPWIARIAKNVSLDMLRGQARRPQAHDSAPTGDELPKPGDEADEIVERLVQRDTVLSVLSDLPEAHRRALMLRELDGRSHREIAHELEISTSQAKALIHRAKGSFRKRWLEKVADRGGLVGIAFLPLLWLSQAVNGFRRVADRLGHATQAAQAAAPEAVTSTVSASASAAPAVTTGLGERLVAAGVTLLLAGGVTVGAVKVVDRSGDQAAERVRADAVVMSDASPPATVSDDGADRTTFDTKSAREDQIPVPVVTEPSPTAVPDPSPSPDSVVEPPLEPTESPVLSPSPEPSPSPDPAPAWEMVFSSDVSSEETCGCSTARSIRTKVDGTPGEDVSWDQLAWAPVLDGEGDVAWSVAIEHRAAVQEGVGTMSVRFTIRTREGSFLYIGFADLSEAVSNDDGGYSYRFVGRYRAKTFVPEEAVAPRQGQLIASVALWPDRTLYLGSFALIED